GPMTRNDLLEMLDFARKKTLDLVESIAKQPEGAKILAWRPGPGRAHIAWQLMHIAATDDRHVHVRMRGGELQEPEYVRRFAGGSTPDDQIPSIEEIRRYLTAQRDELRSHMQKVEDRDLETKPNPQAPWTYHEWMKVL